MISPTLYFTFWSGSLYDIFVPKERYEGEIRRMRRQIEEIDRFVPPIGGEADPKVRGMEREGEVTCVAGEGGGPIQWAGRAW